METSAYDIVIVDDTWDRFEELLALEYEVLYAGFGVALESDWHHGEAGGDYAVAMEGRRIIGSARLICQASGESCQLRQVAVAEDRHGQGVGRALVLALEDVAAARGTAEVWLHARESAFGFYCRLGYEYCSEMFESSLTGIPHRTMRKALAAAGGAR